MTNPIRLKDAVASHMESAVIIAAAMRGGLVVSAIIKPTLTGQGIDVKVFPCPGMKSLTEYVYIKGIRDSLNRWLDVTVEPLAFEDMKDAN